MESILKSDIFFFITSISVVVISIFFVVAFVYIIKILINFHKISKVLRGLSESTDAELRDMGHHIRQSRIFTLLFGKEKIKKDTEKHSKKII